MPLAESLSRLLNNSASIRVAGRLNLVPVRNDVLLESEVVVYARNCEDWSARQPTR